MGLEGGVGLGGGGWGGLVVNGLIGFSNLIM